MSRRKQNTDIDGKSREAVHRRDGYRCVYCGRADKPIELAHFVSRSRGGKGIPQNLISLCIDCHRNYDGELHSEMKDFLENFLRSKYKGWDEKDIVYRKGL